MRELKDRADAVLLDILTAMKEKGPLEAVSKNRLKGAAYFEVSQDPSRGDLSSACALQLTEKKGLNPKQLAEIVADQVAEALGGTADKVMAEGPGFVNIFLNRETYLEILKKIYSSGADCGRGISGTGRRVLLEFVSANPTGPLSVAHGRQAAVGDTLARILSYTGHEVTREYFLNDTGNQIDILGQSIYARLLELSGREFVFPEEGYQGDYIREIAQKALQSGGERFLSMPPADASSELGDFGMKIILDGIREDLDRFRVRFDEWTSQAGIERSGAVEEILSRLDSAGHTYRKDEAVWLRGTEFGDFQDRVLVKANGSYTYRTPDIAYHSEKFARGFDTIIDLWGPDHHGHIPSLTSGVKALGLDTKRLDLRIVQQCSIWKDGKKMKMSTRAGSFVSLREVMDEVGEDAARYFFLMRKMDSHLDFDLALAKQRSLENPVYYVQYAHARIAGIAEYALKDKRFSADDFENSLYIGSADRLDLLTDEDLKLVPVMARFPLEVDNAARDLDPQKITKYAHDLSAVFQRFYTMGKKDAAYRVVTDDTELTRARLYLFAAFGMVLRSLLDLMGISAPKSM